MANSKVRLHYLDLNGRAEIIRLVLTLAGKEFEDIRFSYAQWPEIKPSTPFGQVPMVELDGHKYAQTHAIANYFAREFGLYGKTNLDSLVIDQIAQLTGDFAQDCSVAFLERDPEKKAEKTEKVKEEASKKYLGFMLKLLQQNGGEFFVGNGFSLADLIFYDSSTGFLSPFIEGVIEGYPPLKALVEKVGSNASIKAYTQRHQ